ncbi:MAG TPA: cyclic-di-AMP receptor [Chloroflexota bacterium]|nr:cyclic-di-AMP receptor [Chloroflexota bacterium]
MTNDQSIPESIDRLVVAIVNPDDVGPLVDRLLTAEFRITRLDSAGGFLRRGNATLLLGISARRLDLLLSIIQTECRTRTVLAYDLFVQSTPDMIPAVPIEVEIGGATVFVLDAEQVVTL